MVVAKTIFSGTSVNVQKATQETTAKATSMNAQVLHVRVVAPVEMVLIPMSVSVQKATLVETVEVKSTSVNQIHVKMVALVTMRSTFTVVPVRVVTMEPNARQTLMTALS